MKDIETVILCGNPRCGACRILERNGVRDPHWTTALMFILLGVGLSLAMCWYRHPDWFTRAWNWLWATPPCQ